MVSLLERQGLAMSLILWSEATPRIAHFMLFSTKENAKLVRNIEDQGGRPRSPQSHSEEDDEGEHPDNTLHTFFKTKSRHFKNLQRVIV